MSTSLAGRAVVITRPAAEALRLAALVRGAGGEPLMYPAIEILDVADPAALDRVISRLEAFDLAIFVSPSAVHHAMTRIGARRALPPRLKYAAIGPGGVRALHGYGVTEVIAPAGDSARHDSEALLATAFLREVRGKCVVIFRGDGGRELLGETLTERGAMVECVTCYRRGKPTFDPAPLIARFNNGEVAAVIVTSSEGLRNFCERLSDTRMLAGTLMVVPHPRVAAVARELGMTRVVESPSGDESLMATVLRHVPVAS